MRVRSNNYPKASVHRAVQHASARPARRRWFVSAEGFRELRLSCLLSQRACAQLLGVGVRTVRNWDVGRRRVPWAVVRLLRVLRNGELPGDAWAGWRLWGDTLWTPEGHAIRAGDAGWLSLLVRQAKAFRESTREEPQGRKRLFASEARVAMDGQLSPLPLERPEQHSQTEVLPTLQNALQAVTLELRPQEEQRHRRSRLCSTGLVLIATSDQSEGQNLAQGNDSREAFHAA